MAKKKVVEMTDEQIARYAQELRASANKFEKSLGNIIWDAIYASRSRVSSAVRHLNNTKIDSTENEKIVIDAVIARIRGEK